MRDLYDFLLCLYTAVELIRGHNSVALASTRTRRSSDGLLSGIYVTVQTLSGQLPWSTSITKLVKNQRLSP